MKIVIDIPIEWLFDMKNKKFCQADSLYQKILNGTPLPKEHGDLFDKAEILRFLKCPEYENCNWKNCFDCNESHCINLNNVNSLVPIIKAESEG